MKTTLQKEKPGQCHNYAIFIASRYFNNLDDFFNLEIAVKRFRGNMEKFHYNPISLNYKTMHFFPNVETLYLYDEKDEYLEGGRINWYCVLHEISCKRAREIREEIGEENEGEIIEFKKLIFEKEDADEIYQKAYEKEHGTEMTNDETSDDSELEKSIDYIIPNGVKEIGKNVEIVQGKSISIPSTVTYMNRIKIIDSHDLHIKIPNSMTELTGRGFRLDNSGINLEIPTSVTKISKQYFRHIDGLRHVTILGNIKELDDEAFKCCEGLHAIQLPSTLTSIGKSCFYFCRYLTEINIPTTIKEIGEKAFQYCGRLEYLHIPTTIEKIGKHCFDSCTSLTSIDIPIKENMIINNNSIYQIDKGVFECYFNPSYLKIINGKKVRNEEEMIIPNNVTRLGNSCFYNRTK